MPARCFRGLRAVAVAVAGASLGCHAEEAGQVLEWLLTLSGGQGVFPIMDFIASDSEEVDVVVDRIGSELVQPCSAPLEAGGDLGSSCPVVQRTVNILSRVRESLLPQEDEQAAVAEWLLHLDWFELALASRAGARLFEELAAVASAFKGQDVPCDASNTEEDEDFIGSLHRSMAGVESLPLERNEFKWADFFARYRKKVSFCALGVSTLFLVAGDITAYAAGAAGGEHKHRLRRSLLFAQGIVRQHVHAAEPWEQDSLRLELMRTGWPLWQLLASICAELAAGTAALATSAKSATVFPGPFQPSRSAAMPTNHDGAPYLSVIVQCRNDDYGGGMLTRLNRMLTTATMMFHKAGLPAEIIVVEWNPPATKPPIADVLTRAEGTASTVPIRVVRVPPAVHNTLAHHKAHPIFEHIAENVAFRRARGRFFLKTNIDNIFSPDTVLFLARQELLEDAVYRATYVEYDVSQPESEGLGPEALLEWLFGQQDLLTDVNLQLNELSSKYPEDTHVCLGGHPSGHDVTRAAGRAPQRPFYWAGSGDFVLASRNLVHHVRGYPQIAQNWQTDDLIHCRLRAVGARQVVLQPPCVTLHQNHRRINRVRSSTRWVVTDSNFEDVCGSPFAPLPTESGLDAGWGLADEAFEETLL